MSARVRTVMEAYMRATEERDLAAVRDHLAPGAVLHSPVTRRPFIGREEVAEVLAVLLTEMQELEYTATYPGESSFVLVFRARFAAGEVRGCNLIELDDEGLVTSETVFARPLAGAAVFAQALGPKLARRHGRWRAALTRGLPLPRLLEGVDRLGTRVARPHAVGRRED